MIVVTGAAGFIGSCLAQSLFRLGYTDLVLVDDFSKVAKAANLKGLEKTIHIERSIFFQWLQQNFLSVEFIIHIGARTDTTEFNKSVFDELNLHYSQAVWLYCVEYGLPLIYASSAATYGNGQLGYEDKHSIVFDLKPLNPYGQSKNDFDKWALQKQKTPYFWIGLKFFNVYGPNEYHKGRMASVVYHAHNQVKNNGQINLFKSHKPNYKNGEQLRDFVYVKDVVEVIIHFLQNRNSEYNGLYNLGTGKAETFLELAQSLFKAVGVKEQIRFIDTPLDIRDNYQYFTEAKMQKLRNTGYSRPFMSIEEGILDYYTHYLKDGKNY